MSDAKVNVIKALADETRLGVLKQVMACGEMGCQDLTKKFSLSQPTMSHHIKKLVDCEVLIVRKEGVAHFYQVNLPLLKKMGIQASVLLA